MKRPLSAASLSPSPAINSPLKQVLSTPAPSTHPVLRDITNSAQALKNPPDLFPATNTVKRSRRLQSKQAKEQQINEELQLVSFFSAKEENEKDALSVQESILPSKLATTVYPTSEDDKEIELPVGKLPNDDDDDESFLVGPSKIIPELTDLSKNLAMLTEGEFERRCVIEVVDVPFVLDEADDEKCE